MNPAAGRKRTPVIIDTDPGVDDIVAILLALASPELEILAIIVSFGNTDPVSSHLNILKAYQAVERHLEEYPSHKERFPNFFSSVKPILAIGSHRPLEGDLHSAQYFHGRDGLSAIAIRHPELDVFQTNVQKDHPRLRLTDESGVVIALRLLRTNLARTVTYIALGPLTNLAHMMRSDGNLVREKIGRVVCMGGALDVPGNTSPVAEFNFYADPYAVKELLLSPDSNARLPLDRFLLLPLDLTAYHELPFLTYKKFVDPSFESTNYPSISVGKAPLVHFTSSFLERTREVMNQYGKDAMELHDIAAVWCAIDNPPFQDLDVGTLSQGWKVENRVFDIERTGEITRGMLVVDRRNEETVYPLGANRAEVQEKLEQTLSDSFDPSTLPTEKEIGEVTERGTSRAGVSIVTSSPGPDILLTLLLKRVWGAEILKT